MPTLYPATFHLRIPTAGTFEILISVILRPAQQIVRGCFAIIIQPLWGWIVPLWGWIVPLWGWIAPLRGWIVPLRGWIAPLRGWIVPLRGWIVPRQTSSRLPYTVYRPYLFTLKVWLPVAKKSAICFAAATPALIFASWVCAPIFLAVKRNLPFSFSSKAALASGSISER